MKTRILIVDDEPMNLDFFDLMLSKLGFEIYSAGNGVEALEAVKESRPDLILLDNVMPKMSGWQVTRLLKQDDEYKDYRDIPIIMFSAMDDVQDKIEGFELGVDDYITKPFNFSEVIARIRAVIKNRDAYRAMSRNDQCVELGQSLSRSVKLVVDSLETPLNEILTDAEKLDLEDKAKTRDFVGRVQKEISGILSSFGEIGEYILNFQNQGVLEPGDNGILEEFDKRIRAHFLDDTTGDSQ